jgi:phosphatidylserine decarboxylase
LQVRGWLAGAPFQKSFLRYFYRDPERDPPDGLDLLAPADGIIRGADIQGDIRYLVIALSFWDMHVQRSPLEGVVVSVESLGDSFMDGEGQEFAFLRGKPCPVQKRVVIRTSAGILAIRLITSLAARRLETWINAGEYVARGQRIGKILLGSTVVLELPPSMSLTVQIGDRVWAGETVVALHKAPA